MLALIFLLPGFQVSDKNLDHSDLAILDLRFEVSTVRTVLDPSDLLPLTFRWTNGSRIPFKFPSPLIKIFLEEPDGCFYQARFCAQETHCHSRIVHHLGPGEFVELTKVCSPSFLSRREGAADRFRRPVKGGWRVWAELGHRWGIMKSNVLEFRIEDDAARPEEIRRTFGSEAWHRFALGGAAGDADLLAFRKIALGK